MKKTLLCFSCVAFVSAAAMLAVVPNIVCSAEIIAAPNPWIPDDVRPNRGTLAEGIKFLNMPAEGELCIYTMAGSFVARIEFTAGTARPIAWLGKNEDGEYVASGVYLWVVKTDGTVRSGKVIVVR